MSRRKIVVDGTEYTWEFGAAGWLDVRLDGRKFLRGTVLEIFGISWDDFERGQHKRYFSLKPSQVAEAIRAAINESKNQ